MQSPQCNPSVVPVNNVNENLEEDTKMTSPPKVASHIDQAKPESEFKKPLDPDSKPIQSISATKVAEPIKMRVERSPVPQSTQSSGVTLRKKIDSSSTPTSSTHKTKSTSATSLPTMTRTKINYLTTSTGILKPTSSPNIPTEKKVKFNDGESSAKKTLEKPTSARKVEKVDSGTPKTAIKKRIFISSRKPNK